MLGSCFTQNIGSKLEYFGFNSLQNPYGITYNPISIAHQLEEIVRNKRFDETEVIQTPEGYVSFQHHSSFSNIDKHQMLSTLNSSIADGHSYLSACKVLFISLGTAWTWVQKKSGLVVNNCHKFPRSDFHFKFTDTNTVVRELATTLEKVQQLNPKIEVVFTVSPVRHWRNGALENSRSKASLLYAAYELSENYPNIHYFPSYEILMDDLRDYRFYGDDLLHPSATAIEYIWDKLSLAVFDTQTRDINKAVEKVRSFAQHRPRNNPQAHQDELKRKYERLNMEYGIDLR